MSAKKLLVAAVLTTLLTACGNSGNTYQAPLPSDGTYGSDSSTSTDATSGGTDTSTTDTSATPTGDASATAGGNASSATVPADGFTFTGVVKDKTTGDPIAHALVSIGASTVFTKDDGSFSFPGITDTQIWVDVSKDGYESLTHANVAFDSSATLTKTIRLAPTGSSDSGSGDASGKAGFRQELSFGGSDKFKSVSALVVADGKAYVLGVVDGFLWLNRNSVVVYDAASGQEVKTFNKIGALSHLPSDADSLKVEDGLVTVSNGETAYVFNPTGSFVKKTTGARYALTKSVTDDSKHITYTLKGGNTVEVKTSSSDTTLNLDGITSAVSLGLSADGKLLVLDDAEKQVIGYSYQAAQ